MRAGIPDLRRAACRGHAEIFDVRDGHDRAAIARAQAVCETCPVLSDCRAWLASLPRAERPCGAVAGRYIPPPRLRPAYVPRPPRPSSRDRAIVWLRAYLSERGPVLSTQVIADAVRRVSTRARCVKRASS